MNNETVDQSRQPATLTPADAIAPTQLSTLHKIFIGKDGLRAGWSLLIFIAIFAAIAYSVNFIGHKLYPPTLKAPNAAAEISARRGLIAEAIPFLITVLVTWIMSKIERRPNSVYGFGDSRGLSAFPRRSSLGNCLPLASHLYPGEERASRHQRARAVWQ